MKNKLTTPQSILIGSLMIAGSILYTSGNISNPIIGTAHAEIDNNDLITIESNLHDISKTLYQIYEELNLIHSLTIMSKTYLNIISNKAMAM